MSTAARVLAPIALGVVLLVVWEAAVALLDIPPYLLPAPSAIGTQVAIILPGLVAAALATGTNALVGLVGGAVLAIAMAALASRIRWLQSIVEPLVAAIAVVPIVALAPVLGTMFGAASETPRQVVVGIAAFVPVFVNTLRGLRSADPVHRDLLRANGASGWQVTWHLTLPGALPYVFTGLNVASSLAVISAVVAEYFGGLQNGLGSRIASAAAQSGYARAWSYVLAAVVLGLIFYVATLLLERSRARASST
ncbi:ABC transporter permease [Agrococcus jejuensis]|uniref:ABC transporter permease n=1 Tax=Agrococcus jejuensis TaxID=399736 RepID=UPI0011A8D8AD|nr:ABC transporter permease [Agrococcus jejuensis]